MTTTLFFFFAFLTVTFFQKVNNGFSVSQTHFSFDTHLDCNILFNKFQIFVQKGMPYRDNYFAFCNVFYMWGCSDQPYL